MPGRLIYTCYRLYRASSVSSQYVRKVFKSFLASKETHTFTYGLTPENETYLINLTAEIVKKDIKTIEHYFNELKANQKIKETLEQYADKSPYRMKKDKRCEYGIKLSFYAIVRALKSKVVVENGMEVGFTSIVLCEAIRKNREEGFEGKFIGLDLNKDAGYYIKAATGYESFSEIMYGDAIESLKQLKDEVDFYFSDGLRTYEYEKEEFACLENKLDSNAIVVTNKAKFSKALYEFSIHIKRRFSFFNEQPLNHWFEGSGIGILHP